MLKKKIVRYMRAGSSLLKCLKYRGSAVLPKL